MVINSENLRFLMISGHDYRSPRKANVHFIAEEFKKIGPVRFFSIGYSLLSLLKKDPRSSLWRKSNSEEEFNGVECYLWRSLIHPFNFRSKNTFPLEKFSFELYVKSVPNVLRRWILDSNFILLESGMPVILFSLIKKINPGVHVVYLASDDLATIGCSPFIQASLQTWAPHFDGLRLPSRALVDAFPRSSKSFLVPHGLDARVAPNSTTPSPYTDRLNAVSVGSMLFDREFFLLAAPMFPEVTFHIIGGGYLARDLNFPNVKLHSEMPFGETLAYIQHANIGIAPYRGKEVAPYLADTSMKLAQYGAFGLPSVCPRQTVGKHIGRFGYEPGEADSIRGSIHEALQHGPFSPEASMTWRDVALRIIDPGQFPDTFL